MATLSSAGQRVTVRQMARKVLSFPPFVALLSVGMQLRFDALRARAQRLCAGLDDELLVGPALVVALLWLAGAEPSRVSRVIVISARPRAQVPQKVW